MDRFSVAIIIPAFNEALTIGNVVKETKKFGLPIVVDDGSTDGTGSIAAQFGAEVVTHQENKGYDFSINSGFAKACALNYTYVVTFDADGQHPSYILAKFIENLKKGYDLVVGIRPKKPRISEFLFSLYTKFRYGLEDPLCGMKAYNMKLYRSKQSFSTYPSIGTELSLFALKNKHPFCQIKIDIKPRLDSARFGNKIRSNFKILYSLLIALMK